MHVTSIRPVAVPAAASPLTPPLETPGRIWTVAGIHTAGLYLMADAGPRRCVMPVIGTGAYDLPTAVRTHVPADVFTAGLRTGDQVRTEPNRLLLPAAELHIRRTWRPSRISGVPSLGFDCGHAGKHLAAHRGTAPDLSAARAVLRPGIPDAEARADGVVAAAFDTAESSEALRDRVDAVLTKQIAALVGRGPGLTPSGDDVLCGIALALRWQSAWCALDRVRTALTPHLSATTAISASLLDAALDGWCTTPVHKALTAAQTGDSAGFAGHLSAIGHTSGHDLGAGVVATCLALTRASARSPDGSPLPTEGGDRALSR